MIKRDEYGIIVQHPDMDGGDSAARTGIMALGSLDDNRVWFDFIQTGQLVRHPYQAKWNDPKLTSRDQLVQFYVAANETAFATQYTQQWFINKDFLDPAVRLYLHRCSWLKAPLWLELLGTAWMWAALLWNTKVKPNEEMNMFCCLCLKAGPAWVQRLYKYHPDIEANIRSYWCGWRDQAEIGETLITALKQTLKQQETT